MDHSQSEQVKQVIADVLNVDTSVVTDDLSIGDIAEWDSVGNLNVIAAIEQEFNVEIPLDDLFELTSVSGIVAELDKLKQ